jgi:HAD superfamily hydrolase (TIGR01509 family)
LKCLIFDMDGTLTQTNQLIYDAFNYIAEKYRGRTYSKPEINAMFGPPEEEALLSIVRQDQIGEVMKDYLAFYRNNHARLARLYPGIEDTLKFIRGRGKHLALFTGKGIHTTSITLQEFGIAGYFDYVVTGNDVLEHKPAAEGIRKILDHFHFAVDEVLMIGDAVSDVKAARSAGVQIAAVVWDSYGKKQVLDMGADLVFHDVQMFDEWVRKTLD